MTKLVSIIAIIIVGTGLSAGAAQATQIARTWVSGAGGATDANPCTRSQPCATFAGAYANTLAGGEIDVLDGGDFGRISITSALTIANDGAGTAGITTSATEIFVSAGPADIVALRGLNVNGAVGGTAITFVAGGALLVDHCTFQGSLNNAAIGFESSGAATLWVKDTVLLNNGISNQAGILIAPHSGATAAAHLERVQILHAIGNGIRVDGTNGGGSIEADLRDVTVDGSSGGSGIVAVSPTSGGPPVKIFADNVTSTHNPGFGFRAVGGTASVTLSRSVSENNGVGIGVASGGQIFSYGDNRFANNAGGDGVAPTPIGLK
jgi:hypothetical protein